MGKNYNFTERWSKSIENQKDKTFSLKRETEITIICFYETQAIRRENQRYGICISTLCPGATKTNFTARAGKNQLKNAMEAQKVASIAYEQFLKGKNIIIPGMLNRLAQLPPKKLRSLFIERLQRKLKK